jgi:RibD C-terminal domain
LPDPLLAERACVSEEARRWPTSCPCECTIAKLIYSAIMSLDGYVEDEDGNFDWAVPDEEVLAFVNDLERPIGTYLYGRRMYETMISWETASTSVEQPPLIRDFAEIWQAAEKIVYSRRLQTVSSARTRIERAFDPELVRRMKRPPGAGSRGAIEAILTRSRFSERAFVRQTRFNSLSQRDRTGGIHCR